MLPLDWNTDKIDFFYKKVNQFVLIIEIQYVTLLDSTYIFSIILMNGLKPYPEILGVPVNL